MEILDRSGRWAIGLGRDKRLGPFVRAMQQRYPGLGSPVVEVPMELDAHRNWVFMALPWSYVAGLIEVIAPLAFAEGLALYDPQRDLVALPAPFGTAPLGVEGVADHERMAEEAFSRILQGTPTGPDGQPLDDTTELARDAFRTMSPLGFEITPDIEDEVKADPTRVPSSLQTSERKAELLRQMIDERAAVRHQALTMLTGWDPDPDVRAALRPLLQDDDVHVVRFASMALARQGSPTDLTALLDAVHHMSPADGGTLDAMLGPLMAALDLAAVVGPEAVAEVKAKAQVWRVPARGRAPELLLEEELDRLLG